MDALPDWMYPPREAGWFARDLDRLRQAPAHTELMHGALVFTPPPSRPGHRELVDALEAAVGARAPHDCWTGRDVPICLDQWNRAEADLVTARGTRPAEGIGLAPDRVRLVIEVVSPESAHRDRTVKLRKYAEAGIPHYWCIEDESGAPVVHAYELDRPTGAYVGVGIFRHELKRPVPFEVVLDLDALAP